MESQEQTRVALINGRIASGGEIIQDHAIIINEGLIEAVIPQDKRPLNLDIYDLAGHWISPGFIDLQLNGCGGVLFNADINSDTLETMHQTNLKSGCTSFLPTLITCSDADMEAAIAVTAAYKENHPGRIPGLHLEGPWLNPKRRGIHSLNQVRQPTKALLKHLLNHAGTIKMLTLAPEVCPPGTITQLTEAGIIVAIGHTNATTSELDQAIAEGARFATHLFNAMPPLANREPGPVGAVLSDPRLGAGIIADGIHVHWRNIELAWRLLGSDRLCLVTDATPAAGTQIDSFDFAGQQVFYRDGRCVSADGTIGGSALTLDLAIRNCIKELKIPAPEALKMATQTPARWIGESHHLGSIAKGQRANLTVMNDEWQVTHTFSDGQLASKG